MQSIYQYGLGFVNGKALKESHTFDPNALSQMEPNNYLINSFQIGGLETLLLPI